jgi:cephalosporin hydroxylase
MSTTHTNFTDPEKSHDANHPDRVDIDLKHRSVTVHHGNDTIRHAIDSAEGFAAVGQAWLLSGWQARYAYAFSWLGRPIIQLPEDAFRLQEIIFRVKPDVIVETGIAHGGSLLFHATLCRAMGKGRVIGVDIDIRPHNRQAIEEHELKALIQLIEGNSILATTKTSVATNIRPNETVMVILDACHSKEHVLKELELYAPLVTPDSYIIVMDGIMEQLAECPQANADWAWNNPSAAAKAFIEANADFAMEEPSFVFNEGSVKNWLTYAPGGVLKRLR